MSGKKTGDGVMGAVGGDGVASKGLSSTRKRSVCVLRAGRVGCVWRVRRVGRIGREGNVPMTEGLTHEEKLARGRAMLKAFRERGRLPYLVRADANVRDAVCRG